MAPKHTYGDDDDEPEAVYHESSDEDFNPDDAPADDDDAADSSDEDDNTTPAERTGSGGARGKRKVPVDDDLDSGDEVTIQAARSKSKKRKKADQHLSDDDNEGGLIKTRAQRAVEKTERRPLARTDGATVDVDSLWARMIAAPLRPAPPPTAPVQKKQLSTQDEEGQEDTAPAVSHINTNNTPVDEDLVPVTKTFLFAGQSTTEEKHIPRSALAQYTTDGWSLAHTPKPTSPTPTASTPKQPQTTIRRPLKRPSRFDPNPTGFVRALPPAHQLSWPRKSASLAAPPPPDTSLDAAAAAAKKPDRATKLNVVDKSRMDWSGFVDQEGIAAELQEHGKSKDNYMSRRDFLAGVEARREEEGRRGRVANTTALT